MRFNHFNIPKNTLKVLINHLKKRCCHTITEKEILMKNIRNIGILAHIDAGKTTTTERMLFYSGKINTMGEVHHGNTVTDWMEQERQRGITITSAAVSFFWNNNHQFNLIDTPGHIDFTMEVEQTLNVLDGAVVILDGSAGVEAQTLTVWRQANRYKIPRMIFVNKMDRIDGNLNMCIESIKSKLDCFALPINIPIKEDNKLVGIIDVLSLDKLIWNFNDQGKTYSRTRLSEKDGKLWENAFKSRLKLIDDVSSMDDKIAEEIISSENMENVSTSSLVSALRRITLEQKAVPVFCGSAYKNIGIQPLMDAIILYLPSPFECNEQFKTFGSNLCAKAFKVIHDDQRGPLVFFRIYSGNFVKGQKLYNIQQNISEQIGKMYIAYADDYKEVHKINNGNIAVATGLKSTKTGDVVTSSLSVFNKIKNEAKKHSSDDESENNLFGIETQIPSPVFFCSIEPPSLSYATALEQALTELSREDPSLKVVNDEETGQTILGGMGELHLDIIKERIRTEYKIDAELGPLQIGYKETPTSKQKLTHTIEHKIGNTRHSVTITMSVIPTEAQTSKDILLFDKTQESAANLANIFPKHLVALRQGVEVALNHGPKMSCPVVGTNVMLHWLEVGRGTSETIISAATSHCIQKLLTKAGVSLLEPIMYLEIVTTSEYLSTVLADLSGRRTLVENIVARGSNRVIEATTPLSELIGYSTTLRTITSGTTTFSMEFRNYQPMNTIDEAKAIQNITGI